MLSFRGEAAILVPTLCVGMQTWTFGWPLCVQINLHFPASIPSKLWPSLITRPVFAASRSLYE
ncbi:MAG: hypothetical protein WCX65_18985, partial [bacterium]